MGAMIIRYRGKFDTFPPLTRVKPVISDLDRQRGRESPPPALPAHCKPWTDANSYGLLMRYPYHASVSITGTDDGSRAVRQKPEASRLVYGSIIGHFSRGHFGLGTMYSIQTDPGIGVYINAPPWGYANGAVLVPGIIETWWYPDTLFIVFREPAPGVTVSFAYGDPLCILMPVICDDLVAKPMTEQEYEERLREKSRYDAYRDEHPKLQWTSAEGEQFSRRYKLFSKQNAIPSRYGCPYKAHAPDAYQDGEGRSSAGETGQDERFPTSSPPGSHEAAITDVRQ